MGNPLRRYEKKAQALVIRAGGAAEKPALSIMLPIYALLVNGLLARPRWRGIQLR